MHDKNLIFTYMGPQMAKNSLVRIFFFVSNHWVQEVISKSLKNYPARNVKHPGKRVCIHVKKTIKRCVNRSWGVIRHGWSWYLLPMTSQDLLEASKDVLYLVQVAWWPRVEIGCFPIIFANYSISHPDLLAGKISPRDDPLNSMTIFLPQISKKLQLCDNIRLKN